MSRVQAWQEVVEKVKTRLSKWKMKTLSIGGRLTLLKSVLGSIPIFHMSLFRVPSRVLQILESIRSRFFNGHEIGSKKVSWVKWNNVLTDKNHGGLDVSSLCDVLPTRMNLSRRGIDIQAISCPICDYGVESSEHLFFRCNMIRDIGKQIVRWWNINYEEVSSYEEWKTWLTSCRMAPKLKQVFEGVWCRLLDTSVNYLVICDYVSKVIIRSKLNYFWLIKKKLDVKRHILFQSTCFGPWLDLMLFDHEPLVIDYMLRRQHKVDDQHHDMPLIYYMEGHSLHFGRREFSLIIGFRFGTVNFDLHPFSDLKFHNRVFLNKIGFIITNLDIIGFIEDEERFGKLFDDDAIRLCLLLALEVIFMGRLLTFKVDDTLFRLVENLEAWNSFPWGEHLWCHLYDEIKNSKQRHSDEHYYGLNKDRNYVPTYTLSHFVFAFQESRLISDLRHTIAEYQSSWWIDNNIYFQEHVPRAPSIKEQHSLLETYLAKLEKACKHGNTCFIVSSIGGTSDNSVKKKWLNDLVIMELNDRVFKLETIIQTPIAKGKQNSLPLILCYGERYTAPWSEVDQVFIPINGKLNIGAFFRIFHIQLKVTFYDTGYTYDYDYRDWHEQILELKSLIWSNVATESVRLLNEFQYDNLESTRGMMRLICETQLKVQLPVVLERANVFKRKE
ncbi:phospholipase-like protein [Tanacetum coccineum]